MDGVLSSIMMRRFSFFVYPILAWLAACDAFSACKPQDGREGTAHETRFDALGAPSARILWVSDLKAQLEPCGCTSRPLGGVDRLVQAIEEARSSAPSALIFSGRVFSDGTPPSPETEVQKRLERDAIAKAIEATRPDLIASAPPNDPLEEDALGDRPIEGVFSKKLGELELVFVYGIAVGPDRIDEVAEAHPERAALIVVHSGSRSEASTLAQHPAVDFVLYASGEDEFGPPRSIGGGQLLQAGDRGQRLLVLDLYVPEEAARGRENASFHDESPITKAARRRSLEARAEDLRRRIAQWMESGRYSEEALEEPRSRLRALEEEARSIDERPRIEGKRAFIARLVEIAPSIEAARAIKAMMRAHDRAVNQANAVAFANAPPIAVPEGSPSYIGSSACASCHAEAYAWWKKHRHGRAYQTLVDRHKEFSMSCFQCHVTGYGQPGGATITFNLGGELKNVGCESCHGPGEFHARSPLEFKSTMIRSPEERLCRNCHDAEHSDQFDFEIYRSRLLVPGHGL